MSRVREKAGLSRPLRSLLRCAPAFGETLAEMVMFLEVLSSKAPSFQDGEAPLYLDLHGVTRACMSPS